MASLGIPALTDPEPETLVKIRESEESFAEFRAELSASYRRAETWAATSGSDSELVAAFRDELTPRIAQVERAAGKSGVLGAALGDASAELSVGVATLGGTALASSAGGTVLTATALASGAAGVVAAGITGALKRLIARNKTEGANLVLEGLVRGSAQARRLIASRARQVAQAPTCLTGAQFAANSAHVPARAQGASPMAYEVRIALRRQGRPGVAGLVVVSFGGVRRGPGECVRRHAGPARRLPDQRGLSWRVGRQEA